MPESGSELFKRLKLRAPSVMSLREKQEAHTIRTMLIRRMICSRLSWSAGEEMGLLLTFSWRRRPYLSMPRVKQMFVRQKVRIKRKLTTSK
jgi:hypothetical protein